MASQKKISIIGIIASTIIGLSLVINAYFIEGKNKPINEIENSKGAMIIKSGRDTVVNNNVDIDAKKEISKDPRKELANLGVMWTKKSQLEQLINMDSYTMNLFLQGGVLISDIHEMFGYRHGETGTTVGKYIFSRFNNEKGSKFFDLLFKYELDINRKLRKYSREGYDKSYYVNNGRIFWLAVESRNVDAINYLLDNGADPILYEVEEIFDWSGRNTSFPRHIDPLYYISRISNISREIKNKFYLKLIKLGVPVSSSFMRTNIYKNFQNITLSNSTNKIFVASEESVWGICAVNKKRYNKKICKYLKEQPSLLRDSDIIVYTNNRLYISILASDTKRCYYNLDPSSGAGSVDIYSIGKWVYSDGFYTRASGDSVKVNNINKKHCVSK